MPLPKPPSKKAALLAPADFEVQAAPKPDKRTQRSQPGREQPEGPALTLHDGAPALAAPKAYRAPNTPNTPNTRHTPQSLQPPQPTSPSQPSLPPRPAAPAPSASAPLRALAPAKTAPRVRTRVKSDGPAKLFVLDTNVLMHDPTSLFRFEEHDVFLPMITLEELDNHKKGMSEVARNARQVSRELDALAKFSDEDGTLDPKVGIPLAKSGHREAGGKLYFQTTLLHFKLPDGLPQGKADNQILGVVQSLRNEHTGRDVVLVSKDINMRVKARALGLPAEDYYNDKTLEDGDLLYTGVLPLQADFWEHHGKTMDLSLPMKPKEQ